MRITGLTITLAVFVSAAAADDKTTYQDHIKPIFTASCVSCHNPDKNKAGLDLTNFQGIMTGSSAGKVLEAGDPDASTVYLVTAHEIEPHMPFNANKLPDAQIALLRKWIEDGALESSSATAVATAKPKLEMKLASAPTSRPEGPPPMPKELSIEPVVRGERPGAPGALAASPWAPLAALSQPHQILLFNTQTLELLGVLPFADGLPKVLSFSRNGAVLLAAGGVGGRSGHVSLYDVTTGRRIAEIGEEYDEVLAADLSPDQSMVALGGPGRILKVYSTANGRLLHKLTPHTDWITAVAYSPDGVLLASADRNGGLRIWEANTAREFYTLNGHKGAINGLSFRADSNVLVSASEDGTLKLWNMNDGAMIKSWTGHAEGVLSADFARNGQLLSSGRDKVVRLWGGDGAKVRDFPPMTDIAVRAIFAQDDSRIIAASWNGDVTVSNVADGTPVGAIDSNPPTITKRIVDARRKLTEAEAAKIKAAAALASAQASVTKLSAELQQAQTAAATAKNALDAVQAKLTTATDVSTACATTLEAAGKDLAAKTAERDRLAAVAAQATAASQAATSEHAALAAEAETRRITVAVATKAVADAKAELEKTPDNPELVKRVTDAVAARDKATTELAASAQSLAASDQKAKDAAAAVDKITTDLAAATSAVEGAQASLTSQTEAHAKMLADVAAITAEVQTAQAKLAAANSPIQPQVDQLKVATDAANKAREAADHSAAQTVNAASELNKWKLAAVLSELIHAREELARLSDQQAQLSAALEQLDVTGTTIQQGPQQIATAKERLAKATEGHAAAVSVAEAINAKLSAHDAALKQAGDLLNSLNALTAKGSDTPVVSAAQKAKESHDLLSAEAESIRKSAAAATAAVKQATDELTAATAELQALEAALATAPQKLEDARRTIKELMSSDIKSAQSRLEQLTAEAQRLTPATPQ